MKTKQTYMDYAAATPMDDKVVAVMQPFFSESFHNPASIYLAGHDAKNALTEARERVAHWLGAKPSEIVFTAGATEANNLAITGTWQTEASVVCSSIEHESVLETVKAFDHVEVQVDERGMVDLEALEVAISDSTYVVSVIYANNEIGTVQHMSEIAEIVDAARGRRKDSGNKMPLYFHTDASQAANYLDLHVDKLGVDLMTINGGKTYGPKQSGVLYVRAGIDIAPQVLGGGQERGIRSGTENVAAAVGLSVALEVAQKKRKDENYRLDQMTNLFRAGLKKIDGVEVVGHKKHRLPNITSFVVDGADGERLVMMLDEAGYQVGTGSACSALRDESSHVLKAIGMSEEQAASSVRVSLGRGSSQEHIDGLLEILPGMIEEARNLS